MTLHDLVGIHTLTGVEYGRVCNHSDLCADVANCGKFTLDGVTYAAIEDPDDGYRSHMRDLIICEEPAKIQLPPTLVACVRSDRFDDDTLILYDLMTGKLILEVGTRNYNDWYPCFCWNYHPENLACNADKGEVKS